MSRLVTRSGLALRLEVLSGSATAPFIVSVAAEAPEDSPVADVLASAWSRGPDRLVRAVEERGGEGWEGEAGYAYHDPRDEDGIPEGFVRLYYMGAARVLAENEFESLVAGFARFHLEAAASRHVSGAVEEALRSWLGRRG